MIDRKRSKPGVFPPGGGGRGVLGQPIIDPEKVAGLGAQIARATADLEAMRLLAVLPEFSHTWDGRQYTVTVLGVTKTDPFLARAILLAAQEAGIEVPKPGGKQP